MFDDKKIIEDKPERYIASSTGNRNGYVIFRIGQKYKGLAGLKGFQIHMQREAKTLNADKELSHHNIVLVGSKDVYEDSKKYLKDTFVAKNSNVGYSLLLTASPQFFSNMPQDEMDLWLECNVNYLKDQFGDNCVYAVAHMDETTPHIHTLIIPKKWNNRSNKWTLQGYTYFDGKAKLQAFQESYAVAIRKEFKQLKRGIKFSSAKHIDIKKFYSIVNTDIKDMSLDDLKEHTKNEQLVKMQMKFMQETLNKFEIRNRKTNDENIGLSLENKKLISNLKDINNDFENHTKAVDQMCRIHSIDRSEFKAILDYVVKEQTNNITSSKHDLKQVLKKI